MSQTAHDSPARNVTGGRLELVRREDLDIAHLVHGETDVLVPEFGENHRPLARSGAAREAGGQIDHGNDGTAEVDQPAHMGWRAGQSCRSPQRDDLTDGADVTAVYGPGNCEQQESQRP